MPEKKMKLSVILPARNEEKIIKQTVLDIYSHLVKKSYSFEIIVIINGSSDKTEDIVKDLTKKYSRIKPVKSKAGYGFALRKGLAESKGDYIVIFNVDFYDLRLIDLVDIDLYGRDFIIGSKRAHWSRDTRSYKRRLVSTWFNFYLSLVHGFKGSDTHGIKALTREVIIKVLPSCKTSSGIFDTELVLKTQKAGFKIADFPVEVEEKRPSRFKNRIFQTPVDIYHLYKAMSK